jgi:hypothetical protein
MQLGGATEVDGGITVLLKTSRSQVDRILDPKTRHHAIEFAAGAAGGD